MRDEPFVGYRAWRIFDWQEAVIGAAVMDWAWEGPRLSIPEEDRATLPTGSGFHAFRSLESVIAYVGHRVNSHAMFVSWSAFGVSPFLMIEPPKESPRYRPRLNQHDAQTWVIGKVRLFGTVIEYENGYRASDAIMDTLLVHPVWPEAFRARLAARYQCDVGEMDFKIPEPQNLTIEREDPPRFWDKVCKLLDKKVF